MYDQNPKKPSPPDDIDDYLSRYTRKRVREEAQKQGVDPDLAERQFGQESAYKPDVIKGQRRSSAGAIGAGQLMPGTAKDLGVDPYHIDENISGSVRYMKQQLDAFGGDPAKAAAAYNWGPGNVKKYGLSNAPAETQNYVKNVAGQQKDDVDEFLSRWKEPSAPRVSPFDETEDQAKARRAGMTRTQRKQDQRQTIGAMQNELVESSRIMQPPTPPSGKATAGVFGQSRKGQAELKKAFRVDPSTGIQIFEDAGINRVNQRAAMPATPESIKRRKAVEAERARFQQRSLLGRAAETAATQFALNSPEWLTPEAQQDINTRALALGLEPAKRDEWIYKPGTQLARSAARTAASGIQGTAELANLFGRLSPGEAQALLDAADTALGAPKGYSAQKAKELLASARELPGKAEQVTPLADPTDESWLGAKIPQAFGSAAVFGPLGQAGQALRIPGAVVSGMTGAAIGAGQQNEAARKAGVSQNRQDLATLLGALSGSTEALGFERLMGGAGAVPAPVKEIAKDMAQEYGQQYLDDINAKYVGGYDPNASMNPLSRDKVEAAALGGIVSGTMSAPSVIANRAANARNIQQIQAERAPMPGIAPSVPAGTQTQVTRLTPEAARAASQPVAPSVTPDIANAPTTPLTEPIATPTPSEAIPAPSQPNAPLFPAAQQQAQPDLTKMSAFDRLAAMQAQRQGIDQRSVEQRLNEGYAQAAGLVEGAGRIWDTDRGAAEQMVETADANLRSALKDVRNSQAYQQELSAVAQGGQPGVYMNAVSAINDRLAEVDRLRKLDATREKESTRQVKEVQASQKAAAKEPVASLDDLRMQAEGFKQQAAEAERAGNMEAAATAYESARDVLRLANTQNAKRSDAQTLAALRQDINLQNSNLQKARQRMRDEARQANKPTAGIPQPRRQAAQQPPPLMQSGAIVNPEGESMQSSPPETQKTIDLTSEPRQQVRRGKATADLTIAGMLRRRFPQGLRDVQKGDAQRLYGREGGMIGLINQKSPDSLEQAAYALHEEGLTLPDGRPFVEDGRIVASVDDVRSFIDKYGKQRVGGTADLYKQSGQLADYYEQQASQRKNAQAPVSEQYAELLQTGEPEQDWKYYQEGIANKRAAVEETRAKLQKGSKLVTPDILRQQEEDLASYIQEAEAFAAQHPELVTQQASRPQSQQLRQDTGGLDQAEAAPAQVKMMLTRDDRQQLLDLGYSRSDIDTMSPAEGQQIITEGRTKGNRQTEPDSAEDLTPEEEVHIVSALKKLGTDNPVVISQMFRDADKRHKISATAEEKAASRQAWSRVSQLTPAEHDALAKILPERVFAPVKEDYAGEGTYSRAVSDFAADETLGAQGEANFEEVMNFFDEMAQTDTEITDAGIAAIRQQLANNEWAKKAAGMFAKDIPILTIIAEKQSGEAVRWMQLYDKIHSGEQLSETERNTFTQLGRQLGLSAKYLKSTVAQTNRPAGSPTKEATTPARATESRESGERAKPAETGRVIQHSQFGEVRESADQSGVAKGKLRVVDSEGAEHVIQNPRTAGNKNAAFAKSEKAEAESEAQREAWEMTPEEYARSIGTEKPMAGFGLDASIMQLNRMTSRERAARSKERSNKQSAYNDAVRQWENDVWSQYQDGRFSALDVFDTEAFYVLSKRVNDMLSPFKITKMSETERAAYLKSIDAKVSASPKDTKAAESPAKPATDADALLAAGTITPEQAAKMRRKPKISERREAPGFYSAAERFIEAKVPNKASGRQVLAMLTNPQSGVKQAEIDWLGLPEWLRDKQSVTKQELLDFVRANDVQIEEVVKGGEKQEEYVKAHRELKQHLINNEYFSHIGADDYIIDLMQGRLSDSQKSLASAETKRLSAALLKANEGREESSPTKYGKFTLPGAKEGSYRELLLTMPPSPAGEVVPNYRTYAKGRGYSDSQVDSTWQTDDPLFREWEAKNERIGKPLKPEYKSSHFDEPNILAHIRFNERTDADGKRVLHLEEIQSDWGQDARKGKDVPRHPMKKNWRELAFKRALRWAAENGYERMTWTTGEQQAERFDLSKHIQAVQYDRDSGLLTAQKVGGGEAIHERNVKPSKVEDYVGKDIASKLVDGESHPRFKGRNISEVSGLDLKVGGEGMKGFYDSILPAFANKYAKKWGAKVAETSLKTANNYEIANEGTGRTETVDEPKYETVHSLDITPAMRESVMAGQPKFRREAPGAMPERYTGRQLFENARVEFRPARNRPATLIANDWGGAMMNRLLSEKYGESTTDANFTIAADDMQDLRDYLAETKDSGIYDEAQTANMDALLGQMDAAIKDAKANNQDVAFVTRKAGEPISQTKIKVRHETAHVSQSRVTPDMFALTERGWLGRQPEAAAVRAELERRGYPPETHAHESAVFVASGDFAAFGMNLDQATKFLSNYFKAVIQKHGRRALDRFGAIDPRLQPTLERARNEKTEAGQAANERRSVSYSSETARAGTAGAEVSRSNAGVLAGRREESAGVPRISERKEAGFSFGRLENEPEGQIAAAGLGALQNIKIPRTQKNRQFPLPSHWDEGKWTADAILRAGVESLPKDARERYDDPKATAADKRQILSRHSTLTNDEVNKIADILTRVQDATVNGDGGALYDAVGEFNEILGKVAIRNKSLARRVGRNLIDSGALSRALMASSEISAVLRQGAILTLPPTQWGKAAKAGVRMFEALIPERILGKEIAAARYRDIVKEINLHPDAETAKDAGLFLSTDLSTGLRKSEEDFISRWTGKIPIVAASERAYKTYLDSLRMDTFAKYKRVIDKNTNLDEFQKRKAYKAAAEWINTVAGRGSVKQSVDQAFNAFSLVMFAPRYVISRFQVLNPYAYAKNATTAEGRTVLKQQMGDALQYGGMVALTMALAHAAGASVGFDPDDPDFLKIRFGNTRYDVLAGLQQPMRLIYRLSKDVYRRTRGQKSERGENALDILGKFARSKLAPIPSAVVDFFKGRDFIGRPFEAKRAVIERVTPLFWKDFVEAAQREGVQGGIKMLPGALGVGVQDYEKKTGTTSVGKGKFGDELKRFGLEYDYVRPKEGEPPAIHKKRADRVEGWMNSYGEKLVNHPLYNLLTAEQKQKAIENLRDRVGKQMNLVRPDERTLEPQEVIKAVRKAATRKPRRGQEKMWEAEN